MNSPIACRIAIALFVALTAVCGWAQRPPAQPPLPNLDVRAGRPVAAAAPADRAAAVARLRARVPGLKVDFDAITGSPRSLVATDGFLTGPAGKGKTISADALTGFAAGDSNRVTKAFLKEHRELFGHGPEVLTQARVTREDVAAHSGMRTVVWEQTVDEVPVFQSTLIAHTTKRGELISLSSRMIPNASQAAERGTPNRAASLRASGITAREAVARAAQNIGTGISSDAVSAAGEAEIGPERRQKFTAPGLKGQSDAKLIWLPMNRDALRLCWDVVLMSSKRGEMYRVLVDANTGEVLVRQCLTRYATDATYRVFTSDSPSPLSPGHPTPLTNQPPLVPRTLVTWTALDTNASPAGWIPDGGNQTLGNNVDAHTDLNADDLPDLPRPQGSPFRVFDFPMDLNSQDPTNYAAASIVQLFYLCNWYHDRLYQLGFTEAAGNFQSNNFARGGLGNDAIQADAQDGSGTDNANFSTPPDGLPGLMQMYIFTGMSPRRDGDLDAEIVFHEYTHGLSWRLVGGGQGLGTTQSDGMGEGWSDFYSLALLSEAGDDVNACYAAGGYASHRIGGPSDTQNYYFGIRRYPYSTDLAKNPLTFNDIDPSQADYCASGAPYHSAMFGSCSPGDAAEVHNMGEVWCMMLWEARAKLVTKYGWAVGNELILQLVTDGMKLSPPAPNFIQARDAILQADLVNNAGANHNELWAAFARRGLGFSATSPDSDAVSGVHEAFDIPDDLRITPNQGFTSRGPVGGPFDLTTLTLVLTNAGSNAFNWMLVNTSAWLIVTPTGGTLLPGGVSTSVTADLSSTASTLPMGLYAASVWFTNRASGAAQERSFQLRVGQPDYFTELFNAGDNDLAFKSFTFTPDGSASYYAGCVEVATNFPTDPAGGVSLYLNDDDYAALALSGTNTVAIYQRRSGVLYVGSNGYLTMDSGDEEFAESFAQHFNRPRISALFDDLDPELGGTVSWKQLNDRVAVTFLDVPEYDYASRRNSFQVELFFDGRIRVTYLRVSISDGLAGLSAGLGLPAGFEETDLSGLGECLPPDTLAVTPRADLDAQGYEGGPFTPTNAIYLLRNAGSNSLSWSAGVDQPWLALSASTGTLAVSATTNVTLSINPAAALLAPGSFSGAATFTNHDTGFLHTRGASLLVKPIPGEIIVLDSLPPAGDLQMPFGPVFTGATRTEQITVTNTDSAHGLVISKIGLGLASTASSGDTALTVSMPGVARGNTSHDDGYLPKSLRPAGRQPETLRVAKFHPASHAMRILMVASGAEPIVLRSGLADFPDISVVDYYDAQTGTPTLAQLDSYDAVLVMSTSPFSDAVGMGNVLADYVDGGGALVEAVALFGTGGGYELSGRLVTGGYEPFIHGPGEFFIHTLGSHNTNHPIMTGVLTLTDGLPVGVTLRTNAQLVASWDNGRPLAGVAASGVVGINVFAFDTGDFSGDVPLLFHNALAFSSGDRGFSVTNLPALPHSVPPAGSLTFDVVYRPVETGSNAAAVVIESNDADEPRLEVQLTGLGILDYLQVTPETDFTSSGHPGGPFVPASTNYVVGNVGPGPINWVAIDLPPWVSVIPSGGTLSSSNSASVTVGFTAAANALGEGTHAGVITFSNLTTTAVQRRAVTLTIFTSPQMVVMPGAMSVTNVLGGATNQLLVVSNAPAADGQLTFRLIGRATGRTNFSLAAEGGAAPPAGHDFTKVSAGVRSPDHVLVRFAAGATKEQRAQALNGARVVREYRLVPGLCLVQLPAGQALAAVLPMLNRAPGVLYAEPDYTQSAMATIPNDALFSQLWGMNNTGQTGGTPGADINAPEAWDLDTGSRAVTVAVIDTGVDYTHPDLVNNLWTNPGEIPSNGLDDDHNGFVDDIHGYDFANGDANPMDDHGHGTHCAGTIGAEGDNTNGVVGVCWNVRIMAMKFLDESGSGNTSDAILCIDYAAQMGARVLNNSWGGGPYVQSLKDAIDAAGAAGILFVAAAGNDGINSDSTPFYPSCYTSSNILSVMAVDHNDVRSSFSNYGFTNVDLAAPGTSILSCAPGGGYQSMSGTSMAAPHVAGACALLLSANPSLDVAQLKEALLTTVDPTLPGQCVSGGRMNLARALGGVSASWLTFTPAGGTNIAPGSGVSASVGFHASDLPAGVYSGEIVVRGNDPVNPVVTVPVSMTIRPDDLLVSPSGSFASSGAVGGPFAPTSTAYVLTNRGAATLYWTVGHTQSWVHVTPAGGTLAAGQSVIVKVALTAAADALPAGDHADSLMISNTVSGAVQRRAVDLEVLMPTLNITDAYTLEGDSGFTNLTFLVQLSPPSRRNISVAYATADGSAWAGTDYLATNGLLVFAPGQTQTNVTVMILGDADAEPNEAFSLVLLTPTNAAAGDGVGTGTILTDDLAPDIYIRSISGAPWEGIANETAMDRVFGTNNWQDERFETAIPAAVFSPATRFVFLEGSDVGALELQAFLATNLALIQDWVAAGGRLLLNAAPNEGSGMNLGFGVTLTYPDTTATGVAAVPLHPIFAGPFTPVGTVWSGDGFGHATVSGSNLTALILNSSTARIVLGAQSHGAGMVLFGGMTTDNFHSPQPQASNLRANILDYTARVVLCTNCPPTIVAQPADQAVRIGTNVTLCVGASGTAPLIYQWRKDGTNLVNGGRVTGATTRCLTLAATTEADSGSYSVLVTNGFGSALSSNAVLLVSRLDHFTWSSIASPKRVGAPFNATITARDELGGVVSNFHRTVWLRAAAGGGSGTNTILGAPTFTHESSGDFTLGCSFTPDASLTVTHVRHCFGDKVSIWTDAGTLLAAQNVSSTPGTWLETPLATPVQLDAGTTYRVGCYTANGSYYWRNDMAGTFPNGTINQSYEIVGDGFPTISDSLRWWFVDLRYTIGTVVNLAISPTNSGNFTNGVWTGDIVVLQPATNVVLDADDGSRHRGTSNPFDMLLADDLNVTIVDQPDPVASGSPLVNLITVGNSGPGAATGVTATNFLPAGVNFVSATASQGSCNLNSGRIECALGTVAGGASATITVITTPFGLGAITNRVTVGRAEADAFPGNNSAVSVTSVKVPALSIADAKVAEGNAGVTNLVFAVQLSPPTVQTVTVAFTAVDGLAQAGTDYLATNGVLTFAPGQTNQFVIVPVIGDTNSEPIEVLFVNLSNATNAIVADAQGVGTILTDDAIFVAVFDNPRYVDTVGGTNAESDTVQASLTNLGFTVITFTNITAAAAANSILLFPEFENRSLAPDLTSTERIALSNFVAAGGLMIVHGQGSHAGTFINLVFGFGVLESTMSSDGSVFTRTPAASGTQFEDDPTSIMGNNGQTTLGLADLPPGSRGIYTNGSAGAVVEMLHGEGKIIFLGWDWWNAAPIGSQDGGWLTVLESAVLESGPAAPKPPAIVVQPLSRTVTLGQTANFSVTAFGTPPLRYFWRKEDAPIADATNTILTLSNVRTNDAGLYRVLVTNLYGSALSSNAVLIVEVPSPPVEPFGPIPANHATGISVHTPLSWNNTSPASETSGATRPNTVRTGQSAGMIPGSASGRKLAYMRDGVAVLEGVWIDDAPAAAQSVSSSGQPLGSTLINFDDIAAPCAFYDTVRLTDRYSSVGVTFAGPGGFDGAAVVNQCGSWNITGHSPPNFLGFNTGATLNDGGIPIGPETLYFDSPVSEVRMLAGVGFTAGSVTVEAFNAANALVSTDTITLTPALSPLTVSGSGITRVVIAGAANAFVIDDLSFVPDAARTTYSVRFGTNPDALPLIATNLTETACSPGTLAFDSTYYWQVIASNVVGSVTGAVWRFTTVHDEVHFAAATNLVFENAGTATIAVVRENPAGGALSVQFLATNGTATAGADFTAVSGTLDLAAGVMSTNFPVTILEDAVGEGNESVSLRLTQAPANVLLNPSNAVLIIVDNDGPPDFRITALLASNSRVVDHNSLTGDDRGGIAVTPARVFVTGDNATARFNALDLSGGASLGRIVDGLCTDLQTEMVYALGNGTNALTSNGGIATTLIELNGATGLPTGVWVPLSQWISMGGAGNGIFSGFGRIVVHNGSRVYDISVPFGTVKDRGAMTRPNWYSSESWAVWGVAEYFGGNLYLTYREAGSNRVVRSRVGDGQVSEVANFSNLSDMASFTVSPLLGRWYFHYEGIGQFGGTSETLGYADALFSFDSTNPPVIVAQPENQTRSPGDTVVFSVAAVGNTPLHYQWRKNGTNLYNGGRISGATSNQLAISALQVEDAGFYSVHVTNLHGSTISSNAVLMMWTNGGVALSIIPTSLTRVENCIPFGANSGYGFTGFIYRNVPAFSIHPGDRMRFDLGAVNDLDVRRNIYISQANLNPAPGGNPQNVSALGWTKIVPDSQVPLNPRGDTNSGNFELTYTIEGAFTFPGGGLILAFGGSPPGTFSDSTCDQVLVVTTSSDASGKFHRRFYSHEDQTTGVLDQIDSDATALGGVIIESAMTPTPTVILPLPLVPGQIGFGYATAPGWFYTIEYTTNLEANPQQTVWVSARTTPGDGAAQTFTEPVPPGNPQRFYRLRVHQ